MMNRRPDARSDARERALYLLYEAASKRIDPIDVLEVQLIEPDPLTVLLVRGVSERMTELDERIRRARHRVDLGADARPRSERPPSWSVRAASPGLTCRSPCVIDEAVELAKRYSTDDSGRFVNGVLAASGP